MKNELTVQGSDTTMIGHVRMPGHKALPLENNDAAINENAFVYAIFGCLAMAQ